MLFCKDARGENLIVRGARVLDPEGYEWSFGNYEPSAG